MADSELKRALARGRSSGEWVASVARYFDAYDLHYGHGTDNSSDEAYWLIRAKQSWSPAAWAEPPRPDLIDPVVEIARRRATEHRPLAYLLGEAWFAGLRFTVDGLLPIVLARSKYHTDLSTSIFGQMINVLWVFNQIRLIDQQSKRRCFAPGLGC